MRDLREISPRGFPNAVSTLLETRDPLMARRKGKATARRTRRKATARKATVRDEDYQIVKQEPTKNGKGIRYTLRGRYGKEEHKVVSSGTKLIIFAREGDEPVIIPGLKNPLRVEEAKGLVEGNVVFKGRTVNVLYNPAANEGGKTFRVELSND